MKFKTLLILIFINSPFVFSQNIEILLGNKRFFTDVQSFEHLDKSKKVSLFSRTRATVNYENNTNFFLGEYLSYTTKSGFGLTVQ